MIDPKNIIAKYFSKEELEIYKVFLSHYLDMILDETTQMQSMLPDSN